MQLHRRGEQFEVGFRPPDGIRQFLCRVEDTFQTAETAVPLTDAFARKVALTSPINLWAVLKSVAYAFGTGDWSSDVCSSDLRIGAVPQHGIHEHADTCRRFEHTGGADAVICQHSTLLRRI